MGNIEYLSHWVVVRIECIYLCVYIYIKHLECCLACGEGYLGVSCWLLLAISGFVGVEGEELEPSFSGLWATVIFFSSFTSRTGGNRKKKKKVCIQTVFISLLTLNLE